VCVCARARARVCVCVCEIQLTCNGMKAYTRYHPDIKNLTR